MNDRELNAVCDRVMFSGVGTTAVVFLCKSCLRYGNATYPAKITGSSIS